MNNDYPKKLVNKCEEFVSLGYANKRKGYEIYVVYVGEGTSSKGPLLIGSTAYRVAMNSDKTYVVVQVRKNEK